MRVTAWLVDVARYRDRALMFREVAARVDHLTLVCATPPPPEFPEHPNLTLVPLATRRMRRQRLQLRFARWLRTQPVPDLLHDTQGFMAPVFALGGRGAVRLTSNFASTWDWAQHLRGRWPVEWREREVRYHTQWLGERVLARISDAFTVFGEAHRRPFARAYGVPLDRVFSLPNCVAPDRFAPLTPTVDGPRLLFIGQVFRHKGVHELIDAVALLADRWPTLQVDLIGWTPPQAEAPVRGHLTEAGLGDRMRLVGAVPRADLAARLAAASAVVLPSYSEGSPRVLIEAMACARPIIATAIAGITTLDPHRAFLRLVPRFDARALADAIDATLADPADAERRGHLGRARYEAAHTPAAAGETLATLYRTLLA